VTGHFIILRVPVSGETFGIGLLFGLRAPISGETFAYLAAHLYYTPKQQKVNMNILNEIL